MSIFINYKYTRLKTPGIFFNVHNAAAVNINYFYRHIEKKEVRREGDLYLVMRLNFSMFVNW